MTKALKRWTLAALAASLCALACVAQAAPAPTPAQADWVTVSPAGENFTARMPRRPAPVAQRVRENGLNASGFRYSAAADDATTFIVWSMKGSHTSGPLGAGGSAGKFFGGVTPYLDAVAELAWELLVAPELERLSRDKAGSQRLGGINLGMTYVREFDLNGRPAREYAVNLERERGPVYVSADAERVYVVAALGERAADPRLKLFADSFSFVAGPTTRPGVEAAVPTDGRSESPPDAKAETPSLPVPKTTQADPLPVKPEPRAASAGPKRENAGGGGDAPADNSRPSREAGVVRKAIITFKPEPGFTEEARRFNVSGAVRVRAILSRTGEVTDITVIKGLPHGLTEKAVAAARYIRFEPARMDGQPVGQYVVLEYNFHIY